MSKKLFIILTLSLFIGLNVYSNDYTTNYRLELPTVGQRDWGTIVTNDIVTIDTVLGNISADAAWTKSGTNVFLKTLTNKVGIGTTTPSYALDIKPSSEATGIGAIPLRLTGQFGVSSDNCQLRFAGQKDGELWAIGTDVGLGGSTKNFEFFDLVGSVRRLAIELSTGKIIGDHIPDAATYTVYKKAATYYAEASPETGLASFSGSDFVTVMNSVMGVVGRNGTSYTVGNKVIIREGNYYMESTWTIPPTQDFELDAGEALFVYQPITGDGIILDSAMNCRFELGLVSYGVAGATTGKMVRIYPHTVGPDASICFTSVEAQFGLITNDGETGLSLDASLGVITFSTFNIDEIGLADLAIELVTPPGGSAIQGNLFNFFSRGLTASGIQIGQSCSNRIIDNIFKGHLQGDGTGTGIEVWDATNMFIGSIKGFFANQDVVFQAGSSGNLIIGALVDGTTNNSALINGIFGPTEASYLYGVTSDVQTQLNILSNDAIVQNTKLTILSNDASWTKVGTNVSLITSTNKVGIGTATPGTSSLNVYRAGGSDVVAGDIVVSRYMTSDSNVRGGAIFSYYNSTANTDQLVFGVAGTEGVIPNVYTSAKMVIQNNGTVGIGTTTPTATLQVIGQISGDAIRLATRTTSPDVATTLGPCLYFHSDGSLRLYNGTNWQKVTLQ